MESWEIIFEMRITLNPTFGRVMLEFRKIILREKYLTTSLGLGFRENPKP